MRFHRVRSLRATLLAVVAVGCGGSETTEPPPPGPPPVVSFDFASGNWSIVSRWLRSDGSFEETTAVAQVRTSIGGRAIKEMWFGTRDGAPVRTLTLITGVRGNFVVARADEALGHFDVLEGRFAGDSILLASAGGTRPDGGRDRVVYSEITEDGFSWRAERSADGGATWEAYATMSYLRAATVDLPAAGTSFTHGCADARYHDFDFWSGDWNVAGSTGGAAGTNDIPALLGGCVLEENWSSGETGTSLNMYDARSDLWQQVWIDTNDLLLILNGNLVAGAMVLSGPVVGSQARSRITWTPLSDGRVRQFGESSNNGGASWSVSFDLFYTLK